MGFCSRVKSCLCMLGAVQTKRVGAKDLVGRLTCSLNPFVNVWQSTYMGTSSHLDLLQGLVKSFLVSSDDRYVCAALGQ